MATGFFSDKSRARLLKILSFLVIFLAALQTAFLNLPVCSDTVLTGCIQAAKVALYGGLMVIAINILNVVQNILNQWVATTAGMTAAFILLGSSLITGALDFLDIFHWSGLTALIIRIVLSALGVALSVWSPKLFPSAEAKQKKENEALAKTFNR